MENNLNDLFTAKNEMVKQGQIVDACEKYFADNVKTIDFDGTVTHTKAELVEKMKGFTGSIKKVNGITIHHAAITGDVSFTEFTFDFDMADGSSVLWHEIIRSVWENGQIIEEEYFKG